MRNIWQCAKLLIVILALSNVPAMAQEATPAQVENAIKESGDFPGRQFSVQLGDKEAHVSTYLEKESTDQDSDSKVDAVLLGRTITKGFPGIVRVIVDFYPAVRGKTFRRVSVTKPEIIAFGSGQVKKEDLLSALRVEQVADEQYAAQAKKKQEEKEEKKEQRTEANDAAKKLLAEAKQKGQAPESQWVTYQADRLQFKYPAVWKIQKENDGETIVELDGSLVTKKDSEIELKLYESEKKRPIQVVAQHHIQGHVRWKGHKITQRSQIVKFGVKNAFSGITEDFSYLEDGERWFERHIYFGWPGLTYKIRCSAAAADYNHVRNVFDHLLATLQVAQPAARSNSK